MNSKGLQFLQNTEFAARKLFEGISWELRKVSQLENEINQLMASAEDFRSLADKTAEEFEKGINVEHTELASKLYIVRAAWAKTDANSKRTELTELLLEVKDKELSISTLAGAVLQMAKQGISIAYNYPERAPRVRRIAGIELAEIIWQGRNQAMHFECAITPAVEQVFKSLESTFGSRFSLTSNPNRNMAWYVLEVLEWFSYEKYASDMTELLGGKISMRPAEMDSK